MLVPHSILKPALQVVTLVALSRLNELLPDPAAGEAAGQCPLQSSVRLEVSLVPGCPPAQTFHNLSTE